MCRVAVRYAWLGALALVLVACGRTRAQEPAPPAEASRLSATFNAFGFRLFDQITRAHGEENLFVSPLSVAIALTMTYNGAEGDTRAAIARTIGLDGMSLGEVNAAADALRSALQSLDPKVTLTVANSLWSRQGFTFRDDFLERNRRFFGARVASLDFDDPRSVDIVNAWVRENTNDKIDRILDEIRRDDVLFLVNALYFKGTWTKEFDKQLTRDAPFHRADGTDRAVPMMFGSGRYRYFEGDGVQAASLPYGDGRVSMTVLLPERGAPLGDLLARLNADTWSAWTGQLSDTEIDLALPRFTLEYEQELSDPLKALGMGIAFDPNAADFSGMAETSASANLYIGEVKHKTYVEVNEEGTEAAAVTSVGIRVTSVQRRPSFVADRPFVFAISDSQTGAVLFMGIVNDPG